MTKKTLFVIFGATGDLTRRKLLGALSNLEKEGSLDHFSILGCASSKLTDESFRELAKKSLFDFTDEKTISQNLIQNIYYNSLNFNNEEDYVYLKKRIEELGTGFETEVICYLAISPQFFNIVIENLNKIGINKNYNNLKIIFEKPFGNNLQSAKDLNEKLIDVFDEKQIYRIDHYLGKDAVQNFLVLRFANSLFEPIWNSHYIDNIQITAFEELGVEQRASYYDSS